VTHTITTFVSLIITHGAWSIVVIEAIVIWRLAVYIDRMQARHADTVKQLLLDHNKAQKEETKQLVSAMLSTESAIRAMHDTIHAALVRRE
jgi:hypothetical protein